MSNYYWYIYKNNKPFSSITTSELNITDINFDENKSKCKDDTYTLEWFDENSAHTASMTYTVKHGVNCIPQNLPNISGPSTGNCSGDTATFVENNGYSGYWNVTKNGVLVHRESNSSNEMTWKFPRNGGDINEVYTIQFESECIAYPNDSASTEYTIVTGDTCKTSETLIPIDLGLDSETEWGNMDINQSYYAWGCLNTSDNFIKDNYCLYNNDYTKYNKDDNLTVLLLDNDYANKYSYEWTIPTKYHVMELLKDASVTKNDNSAIVTVSGTSITFPFAGYKNGANVVDSDSSSYFWTSNLHVQPCDCDQITICLEGEECSSGTNPYDYAYCSALSGSSNTYEINKIERYLGLRIRPIREKKSHVVIRMNSQMPNVKLLRIYIDKVEYVEKFMLELEWKNNVLKDGSIGCEYDVGKIYKGTIDKIVLIDNDGNEINPSSAIGNWNLDSAETDILINV